MIVSDSESERSARLLAASLAHITDIHSLEDEWRSIEASLSVSFFQTWDWIGSMLEALPITQYPLLLRVRSSDQTVALGLIGRSTLRRRTVIRSKALHLNESGVPAYDGVTMEHNGLLALPGFEQAAVAAVIEHLARRDDWDELYLSGLVADQFAIWAEAASGEHLRSVVRWERPYHYIDLQQIRALGIDYLESLSANTRYQVRRASKMYAGQGKLKLQHAASLAEAQDWFQKLSELHQTHWQAKGQPGAFASTFTRNFHAALVRRGWPRGTVEIAKISAGEVPLGYVYNFRYGAELCNYQTGLVYQDDPKLKPGLVCHALVAQDALDRGLVKYDLLMGDSQYKKSLTNASAAMIWGVLQQKRLLFRVEHRLRDMRDRWRSRGNPAIQP